MPNRGHERRRMKRHQDRLAVAGNGLYLVGSVLYLVEASVAASWAFVAGSAAALTAGFLPRLVRLWIQPREGEGDPVPVLRRLAVGVRQSVPNSAA